jgi:hypothetical protein
MKSYNGLRIIDMAKKSQIDKFRDAARELEEDQSEDRFDKTLNHLIVLANLTYLDRLLPNASLLRGILYDMQGNGRVVCQGIGPRLIWG